ncbi:helix-turn-helix transcriptional regulator [Cellulosimicrobium sp. NPDC055967]|uniref:helix-turn-helix transcriptional regulator n=1 Tax=Cellulosimicrobium sp. NPDC055967 TaxID=3345670 RepID=UPI0035D8A5A6
MGATRLDVADISQEVMMTRAEFAALVRKSPGTVARWEREGSGPPVVRVGGRPLYSRASVSAWLDAHTKTPVNVETRSAAIASGDAFAPVEKMSKQDREIEAWRSSPKYQEWLRETVAEAPPLNPSQIAALRMAGFNFDESTGGAS